MEQMSCAGDDSPKQQRDPGKKSHQQNWPVVPEGLDVLEFGGEVALEIVLDDEDAEEVGVAAGAEDIPGESGEAKRRESGRMKEAEGVAPALREKRPEKNGAAGENDGCGAFREDGETQEKTEKNESEPRRLWNDGRILISREAQDDGGADHGNREHAAEGHVRGGGVREADHANGGRKQKQQPASCFRAIETKREPCQRKCGEKRGYGARQPRGSFAHAEDLETYCRAPIEKWRFLEPRFSVKARRDPIAGLGHVARDPGVTRLVRPDEANGAEMAEVANVERSQDEDGPADSGGSFGARILGDGGGCFGHGKLSLTSNHYLPAADLLHTVARRGTGANLGMQ